jgi:uncharacterized repeat protein (TIGR02543 family)
VPFNILSTGSSGAGTVAGGGSYPPNAVATATATASPGNVFVGWTGDATGASASVTVLMDSSKSVLAHFTPLLTQSIEYTPPGGVTVRTPPFTVTVTSTSGLPVSLVLDSGPATLAGNVITPIGSPGQVSVTATQPGNAEYFPAAPVVITFAIGPPTPGVIMADDSAATKRSDRVTRATSFTSSSH